MKRIDAWQTFDEARRIFIRIVLGRPIRASSSSSCFELRQHACRHLRKLIHTWTLLHIHWPRPDNVTINFDRDPANRPSLLFNDRLIGYSFASRFFLSSRKIKNHQDRRTNARGRVWKRMWPLSILLSLSFFNHRSLLDTTIAFHLRFYEFRTIENRSPIHAISTRLFA